MKAEMKSKMENSQVFISIIIPVCNSEKTLADCLASVLDQDYERYELIVVDNGSTDGSKRIIQDLQEKSSRVKYVFERKLGRANARNAGIWQATGDVIAMTDSDCIVSHDWISSLTEPIRDNKAKVVMGSEEDAIGNYWSRNMQDENGIFIRSKIHSGYIDHLDTKNFAIITSFAKELMFNPGLVAFEDWDFFLRLKDKAMIKFLPEIKVKHYHDSSFLKVCATQFSRAFYAQLIIKIHQHDSELKSYLENDETAKAASLKKLIAFLPNVLKRFIKTPRKIPYLLTVYLSWELGTLWGMVKIKECHLL